MGVPVGFPDGVAVVRAYLRDAIAARGQPMPVVTRVPTPRPPQFIRIERVGGTRIDRVTDRPRLDVHCWASTEAEATDLAALARALIFEIPGWRGAIAYDVDEVGGPNTAPDPVSGQERASFAVEVSLRGKSLAT